MKNLEHKFKIISESFPDLSSYICFGRACREVKPDSRTLRASFNKLVEKGDYEKGQKENILKYLQKALIFRGQFVGKRGKNAPERI